MNFERLWHWEVFAPNIGNNIELQPQDQLTLELAVGLTKVEIDRALKGLSKFRGPWVAPVADAEGKVDEAATAAALVTKLETMADELAAEWGPFVKLGAGSHSVNGAPLKTLRDYLRFAVEQPGGFIVFEIIEELGRLNSVAGTRALFSGPAAGGRTGTARQNVAQAGSQTAGR